MRVSCCRVVVENAPGYVGVTVACVGRCSSQCWSCCNSQQDGVQIPGSIEYTGTQDTMSGHMDYQGWKCLRAFTCTHRGRPRARVRV